MKKSTPNNQRRVKGPNESRIETVRLPSVSQEQRENMQRVMGQDDDNDDDIEFEDGDFDDDFNDVDPEHVAKQYDEDDAEVYDSLIEETIDRYCDGTQKERINEMLNGAARGI